MRSRTFQLTVNRISEIGKAVDLGVASDLVEIMHSGNIIQIPRSALVELLKCDDGDSEGSGSKNNPRDGGPPDVQAVVSRPNHPYLPGGVEADLGEHQITKFSEEIGLKHDFESDTGSAHA